MDAKKILEKLEMDLSAFLISEMPKANSTSSEAYRQLYLYKGLSISANLAKPIVSRTISIRIGALEADFQSETGEKVSGSLSPDDEHYVRMWLTQNKTAISLRALFKDTDDDEVERRKIVPIDLEDEQEN